MSEPSEPVEAPERAIDADADAAGWSALRRNDEAGYGRLLNLLARLEHRLAAVERGAPLRAAGISVTADGMHIASALDVSGDLTASGDADFSGDLTASGSAIFGGDLTASGNAVISGSATISGSADVTGTLTAYAADDPNNYVRLANGLLYFRYRAGETYGYLWATQGTDGRTVLRMAPPRTVTDDATVLYLEGATPAQPTGIVHLRSSGQIQLHADGVAFISAAGGYQLRTGSTASSSPHAIYTSGNDQIYRAPIRHYFYTGTGGTGLYVVGNITASGTKPFVIDHPLHEDKSLVHAAIEAPVAELSYLWPEPVTLDDDGAAALTLPDYFEALVAADHRAVWVQPVGRPFATGADPVVDGVTTVYGDPGRQVWVRVSARRGDEAGQFEVEIPRVQPPSDPEEEPST